MNTRNYNVIAGTAIVCATAVVIAGMFAAPGTLDKVLGFAGALVLLAGTIVGRGKDSK